MADQSKSSNENISKQLATKENTVHFKNPDDLDKFKSTLIKFVKHNRHLWSSAFEDFKPFLTTKATWTTFVTTFYPDLDIEYVKKSWKSLKNEFNLEFKKLHPEGKPVDHVNQTDEQETTSKWKYYEDLKFLEENRSFGDICDITSESEGEKGQNDDLIYKASSKRTTNRSKRAIDKTYCFSDDDESSWEETYKKHKKKKYNFGNDDHEDEIDKKMMQFIDKMDKTLDKEDAEMNVQMFKTMNDVNHKLDGLIELKNAYQKSDHFNFLNSIGDLLSLIKDPKVIAHLKSEIYKIVTDKIE